MSTSPKPQVEIGQAAIFSVHGKEPQKTTIVKVTPSGRVRVACFDGTFKLSYVPGRYDLTVARLTPDAHVYTDMGKWGEVVAEYNRYVERQKEADEHRKQKAKEQADRIATELAEVKPLLKGDVKQAVVNSFTQANGDRLMLLNIPIKPQHNEYKGGYEVAFVKLHTVPKENVTSWDAGNVEASVASTIGRRSSFSSRSSTLYASDEDALWDIVRSLYHSW